MIKKLLEGIMSQRRMHQRKGLGHSLRLPVSCGSFWIMAAFHVPRMYRAGAGSGGGGWNQMEVNGSGIERNQGDTK